MYAFKVFRIVYKLSIYVFFCKETFIIKIFLTNTSKRLPKAKPSEKV